MMDEPAAKNLWAAPSTDHLSRAWSLLSVYGGLQIMSRSGLGRTELEAIRDAVLEE